MYFLIMGRVGRRNRKPTAAVTEMYERWNVMEL